MRLRRRSAALRVEPLRVSSKARRRYRKGPAMTRRLTSIRLPGSVAITGLMDDGTVDAPEMIRRYRKFAEWRLAEAEAILSADDAEFRVTVVDGVHVERHVRTLQEGRAK